MLSRRSSGVCIPNIGPRGRRRRLIGGFVWLGVGLAASIALGAAAAPRSWSVALVVPFTLAALWYFQAREHT
jgi:hypothetical protein